MPQVIFLPHEKFCPEGMVVEAEPGTSILELAHEHHIEMESACGGVCACTTCHVIVREGGRSLSAMEEDEEDMLDLAFGLTKTSRLGCQIIMTEALDGLVVKLPAGTRNAQD